MRDSRVLKSSASFWLLDFTCMLDVKNAMLSQNPRDNNG